MRCLPRTSTESANSFLSSLVVVCVHAASVDLGRCICLDELLPWTLALHLQTARVEQHAPPAQLVLSVNPAASAVFSNSFLIYMLADQLVAAHDRHCGCALTAPLRPPASTSSCIHKLFIYRVPCPGTNECEQISISHAIHLTLYTQMQYRDIKSIERNRRVT